MDHVRGSSLAWPETLDTLRPFIVTWWSGRNVQEMPASVKAVHDAAGLAGRHINLALVVLDHKGKVIRSTVPFVRPPEFQFDPAAQGKDFKAQLERLIEGVELPKVEGSKPTLTLPDVEGPDRPAGVRIYLSFGANHMNHYRTPVVEAVPLEPELRKALAWPTEPRELKAADLRPWLEEMYPPAIMDGKGGFRKIEGSFRLEPAGSDERFRYAMLEGEAEFVLDNTGRTTYEGTLSVVLRYQPDAGLSSIRGILETKVPKGPETIAMTATIESRPD